MRDWASCSLNHFVRSGTVSYNGVGYQGAFVACASGRLVVGCASVLNGLLTVFVLSLFWFLYRTEDHRYIFPRENTRLNKVGLPHWKFWGFFLEGGFLFNIYFSNITNMSYVISLTLGFRSSGVLELLLQQLAVYAWLFLSLLFLWMYLVIAVPEYPPLIQRATLSMWNDVVLLHSFKSCL